VNGSAAVPVPVTGVWLTGVKGVRGLAEPPAGTSVGPYSVPSTATNVPHAVSEKNSPALSLAWLTAQLRSRLVVIAVSGPGLGRLARRATHVRNGDECRELQIATGETGEHDRNGAPGSTYRSLGSSR